MSGKISFFKLKKLNSFSLNLLLGISLIFSQYLGLSHGIYHFAPSPLPQTFITHSLHNEHNGIQSILDSHFEQSDENPEFKNASPLKFQSKSCTLFDLLMLLSSLSLLSFSFYVLKSRFQFEIDTFIYWTFSANFKSYLSRAPPFNHL